MKWVWLVMVVVLAALQYRYWAGQAGITDIEALQRDIALQQEFNASLRRRNEHRIVEVRELQDGVEGIESMAREELGMIVEGETFFLWVPAAVAAAATDRPLAEAERGHW